LCFFLFIELSQNDDSGSDGDSGKDECVDQTSNDGNNDERVHIPPSASLGRHQREPNQRGYRPVVNILLHLTKTTVIKLYLSRCQITATTMQTLVI
jgi:hypothetical protein